MFSRYSEEQIQEYESYLGNKLPHVLRSYLLHVSREMIIFGCKLCFDLKNIPEKAHNANVRKMTEYELFKFWDHLDENGDDISEHYHDPLDGTIELESIDDRHYIVVRGDDVGLLFKEDGSGCFYNDLGYIDDLMTRRHISEVYEEGDTNSSEL